VTSTENFNSDAAQWHSG